MVDSNDLLNVLCFGVKSGDKYPASVRQFCLGLHFYSPKAYNHIRKQFNKNLPSSRTIQQWYLNSDINGDCGIQEENIQRLVRIVESHKKRNETDICCSLVFDEIDIRQQIAFNPYNGYTGLVSNLDEKVDDQTQNKEDVMDQLDGLTEEYEVPAKKRKQETSYEKSDMAKQAIVFILNGINLNFEFPVAYWFIRGLSKIQRKELLNKVIIAVTKAGVKIVNVSFDCHPCNVPMCYLLGANLNVNDPHNLTTFIINPVNGEKIYIFMDPCHVEKLIRNTLANKEIIYFEGNNKIEWDYIKKLHDFSQKNDFAVHKINKKHIQWKRNSMSVRVANETMSKSVADGLELLLGQENPDFTGASCTIKFIRMVDRLFDVFNSKTILKEDIFKRALNENNQNEVFKFLQSCIECIQKLSVREKNARTNKVSIKPILKSRKKFAFRGIIININSLKCIYDEYVEKNKFFSMLPTYFFQQDVIELFFSRIRSQSRENTNPNVLQFKGAYRKLLCNIKIDAPEKANCRIFDQIIANDHHFSNIFVTSSRRSKISLDNIRSAYDEQRNAILEDVVLLNEIEESDPLLDACTNYTIIYTAASIERKIKTSEFQCGECINVLHENEKIEDIRPSTSFDLPCRSTVDICKHVEKFIKLYDFRKSKVDHDFKVIYCLIFRSIDFSNLYTNSTFDCDINHKYAFVKCIVEQYVAIKAAYISKQITLDQYKVICRHQLTKLIIHRGQ